MLLHMDFHENHINLNYSQGTSERFTYLEGGWMSPLVANLGIELLFNL